MNFQQLRIIRETLRQDFNLTEVATALYTSQPGVSKHIKDLEDELGIEIFVRRGKRLLGLTEPGKELAVVGDRRQLAETLGEVGDLENDAGTRQGRGGEGGGGHGREPMWEGMRPCNHWYAVPARAYAAYRGGFRVGSGTRPSRPGPLSWRGASTGSPTGA